MLRTYSRQYENADRFCPGRPNGRHGHPDLREANVTDVAIEDSNGGYRFSVTLFYDDGEDGYANWWQVETPDGATNAVSQGSDRAAIDAGDCP